MRLDPDKKKSELLKILSNSSKRIMRKEVDITLGIIIKKILMGKPHLIDKSEQENLEADLTNGYRFWQEVYSVISNISNKNSNNNCNTSSSSSSNQNE